LISPHSYFLCREPPDSETQRQLLLVAKVLQNLSNNVQFGKKEEYMTPLNSFIEDNSNKMLEFLDKISVLPENWKDEMKTECMSIPTSAKENSLCIIFNQIHSLAKLIENRIEKDKSINSQDTKDKLKAILSTSAILEKPKSTSNQRASRNSKIMQA